MIYVEMRDLTPVTPDTTRFGFLNENATARWSAGVISPLPDFDQVISDMKQDPQVYGGWCYPPQTSVMACNTETKPAPNVGGNFALPCTHQIAVTDPSLATCIPFFIAFFGLLKGRRLQREGWQHFYGTPVERKLCDFIPRDDAAVVYVMNLAAEFMAQHTDESVHNLAFGALHWHLFAQLYQHEFERFNAQYIALDACYRLAVKTGSITDIGGHPKRAQRLCEHFDVPVPTWAAAPSCELAKRRNQLVHEAFYGGQPLGFGHPADHGLMDLGLRCLVARIFFRILGVDNEYTRSESTIRAMHSFAAPRGLRT